MKKTASQIGDEVLKKLAEGEELMDPSLYEDTPAKKRHWPWAMGGALAGGAAAHYLAPSQMVKDYRETASGLEGQARASEKAFEPYYQKGLEKHTGKIPRELVQQHNQRINDVSSAGKPVSKLAPAHQAQKYFKTRAWQEAMPRNLLGAGLGLGAGLLGSSMLS